MTEENSRSTFVTVVAWIFIVLSAFTTLISILQNVMIHTVMRPEVFNAAADTTPPNMPTAVAFMSSHFHYVFGAFLVVSAFTLLTSVGLLRRWNWARICFVAIMILGVLWNLGALAFQVYMASSMRQDFAHAGAFQSPDMMPFMVATLAVSAVIALGFSGLFGWIAMRLLSPKVAAEFRG